jgi:hypothetical protein
MSLTPRREDGWAHGLVAPGRSLAKRTYRQAAKDAAAAFPKMGFPFPRTERALERKESRRPDEGGMPRVPVEALRRISRELV